MEINQFTLFLITQLRILLSKGTIRNDRELPVIS